MVNFRFLPTVLLCLSGLFQASHSDDEVKQPTATRSAQELMESVRDAVVIITQTGRDGSRAGVGTGFVISKDGLIATSLHVIGENRPLKVTFDDGSTRAVTEIYAWDRKLDLAVIRVKAEGLPALRLGDSDLLRQGAGVVAVGNPQGLAHSIVQGVVSAVREFESGPMIQVAIPIEPGNSGGPLLDMKGRVHGIVNMKSLLTRNLGFATPINALKPLLEKPNTVKLDKWLAIGALDTQRWTPIMGAQWRQKLGTISVEDSGDGFGGRALCLWSEETPDFPYETAVTVLLDDEAGAAGLAFGADGADRHYGFYPSAGELRLTRFDGPSVYTWNILRQISSPQYRSGEWNRLKVRVEKNRIVCFVNGEIVAEVGENVRGGRAGLAKFRDTRAKFREFAVGKVVDSEQNFAKGTEFKARLEEALDRNDPDVPPELVKDAAQARSALLAMAREKDREAAEARRLARAVHQRSVEHDLAQIFKSEDKEADLFAAAFQIARLQAPELEIKPYRDELERMAEQVRARLPETASQRRKLDNLIRCLFDDNGYHGSRSDYYNAANSLLNRVMEDREGIPITLAVVFLELGRTLGIEKLEGMPFPGHFMIRFTSENEEPVYIDVFDGGKIYRKDQLYALVAKHSEVSLREEHFQPSTKKEIVARMLKNLVAFTADQESATDALPYLDLLLALKPDDAYERFRRASLRLRAGDRTAASQDLKWILDERPHGFDLDRVEELYQNLQP